MEVRLPSLETELHKNNLKLIELPDNFGREQLERKMENLLKE